MRLRCLLAVAMFAPLGMASSSTNTALHFHHSALSLASLHHLEVAGTVVQNCESAQPAEALATPDPLADLFSSGDKVAISFVVGIDGRVHSPVILEGTSSVEDNRILQALQLWRYRPATCNAVPAEMESKVEFSSQ